MKHKRTIREEANALTCYAFRNGKLEDLHAGKHSELLDDPKLSRITDAEMKELMIEASAKLAEALSLREQDPSRYRQLIDWMCDSFTTHWIKDEPVVAPRELSKKMVGTLAALLSVELGRQVSESDVESAFKTVMRRKPYGLYSRKDWMRLRTDLRDQIAIRPTG